MHFSLGLHYSRAQHQIAYFHDASDMIEHMLAGNAMEQMTVCAQRKFLLTPGSVRQQCLVAAFE